MANTIPLVTDATNLPEYQQIPPILFAKLPVDRIQEALTNMSMDCQSAMPPPMESTPNTTPTTTPREDCNSASGTPNTVIVVKGAWTEDEDKRLVQLVQEHGARRWSFIASQLIGRNGKQCRERYLNHLDPSVKKDSWSVEEDETLMKAHQQLGNQWAKISALLPGRTANAVKNRWNSSLRRQQSLMQLQPLQVQLQLLQQQSLLLHTEDSYSSGSDNSSSEFEAKRKRMSLSDHDATAHALQTTQIPSTQPPLKRAKVEQAFTQQDVLDFSNVLESLWSEETNINELLGSETLSELTITDKAISQSQNNSHASLSQQQSNTGTDVVIKSNDEISFLLSPIPGLSTPKFDSWELCVTPNSLFMPNFTM